LEAHPVSLVRNVFTIGIAPEFADHLGLVDNPKNRTLVQTKMHELGYSEVQVRFVLAEPPTGWARPAPPAPAVTTPTAPAPAAEALSTAAPESRPAKGPVGTATDFKNDPLIKQALEIFKGQIVEVRA
jgi:hypothetical protein